MHMINNTYTKLAMEQEGKRSLESPMGRWDDNMKIDLKEAGVTMRTRLM